MRKENENNVICFIDSDEYTKKRELFLHQKRTLDIFLGNGAITEKQYNKSLGDLIEKMGIKAEDI